jgi:hypothetical protein
MPMMNWFRGVSADVARDGEDVMLHGELDMVHIEVGPPEEPGTAEDGILSLPGLRNLFGGGSRKKDEEVKPAAVNETLPHDIDE